MHSEEYLSSSDNTLPENEERKVYLVSEINNLSKIRLESAFRDIWIEGEISNLKSPQSGHLYFSLKDNKSQIRGVLFRANRPKDLEIKDGLKMRVCGTISIYAASGSYQIICHKLESVGKGSLQEAFEKLKNKLREEGLFDPSRKKCLPVLPQHIGVVTSATGAAIRDILNVAKRRFPNLHIVIAPVMVQGEDAARQIAHAIDFLNERGGIDVMIIGRGGGNREDLQAFNEECVARAIARSNIPVISGVGHETDFTISDFTADVRAPTPSAAAELLVGQKEEFTKYLKQHERRLKQAVTALYTERKHKLIVASKSYVFREPENMLKRYRQIMHKLQDTIAYSVISSLRDAQQRVDECAAKRDYALKRDAGRASDMILHLRAQLCALNPCRVLERGYSITRDSQGRILRSIEQVAPEEKLQTLLTDGTIISETLKTRRLSDDKKES